MAGFLLCKKIKMINMVKYTNTHYFGAAPSLTREGLA